MIPDINLRVTPRRNMVICSLAIGEHYRVMQDIMSKPVNYYAGKYGMDTLLLKSDTRLAPARPEAWDKVVLLKHLLKFYDTVLWVDSDTLIVNPDADIRREFKPGCVMQLATHLYAPHFYPNTGVWVVHRDPRALDILEDIWKQEDLVRDVWWEQAALMRVLGYPDPHNLNSYAGPTALGSFICPLSIQWNAQLALDPLPVHPYILHYAGTPSPEHRVRRIRTMQMDYETFLRRVNQPQLV
ncbi:hypothetical protein JZ785_26915 [Alicyclobacillus curvatus]|nr:hypothetical protein JZ785_26915 [Alicyclobacillus curvatus]